MSFDPDVKEFQELQLENARLEELLAAYRNERWHATYNAILPTMLQRSNYGGAGFDTLNETHLAQLHAAASRIADRAHGRILP